MFSGRTCHHNPYNEVGFCSSARRLRRERSALRLTRAASRGKGAAVAGYSGTPLAKKLGIAAGAAMLLTPGTAVCERPDVERLFELTGEPVEVGDGA